MDLALNGKGKTAGLVDIPGLTLYGPPVIDRKIGRDPTFSFKLRGYEDEALSALLWKRYHLAVGAEDYYSRVPAMYRKKSMVRVTFAHYNTKAEVTTLLKALSELAERKR